MVERLVQGIHRFQRDVFCAHRELFERLTRGQRPDALFITCSDSRVNPNLLTQTGPGELFILRNAGNVVPPHDAGACGEQATIEFAVVALGVQDLIVCGHSHCGAVKGVLEPESVRAMPALAAWLRHAEATRRIVKDCYPPLQGEALYATAVEENVLVQLDNLRTLPAVSGAIARGALRLHGWVYELETGQVHGYDPDQGQFVPLRREPRAEHPPPAWALDDFAI